MLMEKNLLPQPVVDGGQENVIWELTQKNLCRSTAQVVTDVFWEQSQKTFKNGDSRSWKSSGRSWA
jgi:hypothetical protein